MTVLNQADAIYLGDQAVDAVYLGAEKVWPTEAPPPSYLDVVLADNPTAFWPLDDTSGTAARDLAGTNPGIYTGTYTLGAAGLGGKAALALNGTTGFVELPSAAFDVLDPPSTTIELWFRPAVVNVNQGLVSKGWGGSFIPNPWDSYLLSTTIHSRVGNGTSFGAPLNVGLNFTVPATANAWHHIVAAYDAQTATTGTLTNYLNGQPSGSAQNPSVPVVNGTGRGALGMRINPTQQQLPFNGTLQWAAVYNKALTAQQVLAHYQAGVAA